MKTSDASSQVEALKSSAIIGGSTAIVMLIRMVRTKVVAVLLGPGGVGIEAILDSTATLSRTISDLGVSSSGIRQVAAAVGSRQEVEIARTVYSLRRVCFALGIAGAATLFLSRHYVSRLAFDSAEHASSIGLLAIILLLGAVTGGQGALLQGMRRIGDLARVNIIGTLAGLVVTFPIVMIWGVAGIPYYMVLAAAAHALVSWMHARRVPVERVSLSINDVLREATGLLRLGLAFMASGVMSAGALFLLRVLVVRSAGEAGAGQFQAATALSMVYVGFILQALGTDFYPRLTATVSDNVRTNRLVNEQSEVALVLALPGVLGTIAFAPWVVRIFYSNQFDQAAEVLCWQMSGNFLRVTSWPMGYILLAQGRGKLFVITDAAAWTVYVVLAWLGLQRFGLPGMGMAFVGLYAFHVVMIAFVVATCSGFRWSATNLRLLTVGGFMVAAALVSRLYLAEPLATIVGAGLAAVAGALSLKGLMAIVGAGRINRLLAKLRLPNAVFERD
jgi:PST family polysaccharide transporter